jgi:multidrug resistance efflux pump
LVQQPGRSTDTGGNAPTPTRPPELGPRSFPAAFPPEAVRQASDAASKPAARPTPLPKRPKGRLFVGAILVTVCVVAGYAVWDSLLRYRAYGTITGRLLSVSAPWDGQVSRLHVREGDRVRQGQLLVTLENVDLAQRVDRLGDELAMAQANLDAEISRLRWESHENADRSGRAVADYYEKWGELLHEQSELAQLQPSVERVEKLNEQRAVTQEEREKIRYEEYGQRQKVDKLITAVDELGERARRVGSPVEESVQLKPRFVAIENLQSELGRLRELLDQGRLRSPVNGLVVTRFRFTGETARQLEPVLQVLEEGSLELVLYLQQKDADLFAVGSQTTLVVDPYPQQVACRVVRLGEQLEAAPESIRRYYRSGETLLPVYLEPRQEFTQWMALRVGGVVELPYRWPN